MHMRSHVKVCSLTTYHILLVEFEEPLRPTELHALKLTMSFQIWIAQLPSYWLVSQTTSLSQHLAEQGANTWHKLTTMWNALWVLSHWLVSQPNITSDDIKEIFLA